MNRSTFNLLVIITAAIYIIFGMVMLIKHRKYDIPYFPDVIYSDEQKPTAVGDKSNPLKIDDFAYYIKDPNPNVISNSTFDLVVTDYEEFKKEQVAKMKLKQNKTRRLVLSYVSLGMAENYRNYWNKEWNKKLPSFIGSESLYWKGNYIIKRIDDPNWWRITTSILDDIISKNFDGILIGGVDSYVAENNLESRRKMIEYVVKVSDYVKKKNKNFIIMVQNSEELTNDDDYIKAVDGILKEDLVFTWKSNGNTGPKTPITELNKSIEFLKTFKLKNKTVLVVEYVSGDSWKFAKDVIDKNGFIGYSAPRELNVIRIQ